MDLIKDLWRGDVPLARTFWIFGFSVNIFLFIAGTLFSLHALRNPSYPIILLFKVYILFVVLYCPFIYTAIWKSANKYSGLQRYAILAKIVVIIGWMRYILELKEIAALREFLLYTW